MPSISIISVEERGTVQKSLEEERQDLTTTIRSKTSDGTNLTQNIDKRNSLGYFCNFVLIDRRDFALSYPENLT
jgi:hypothetical protein